MSVREVVTYPEPILLRPADPVPPAGFGRGLERLCEDMAETMYAASGIGLAAPQIAVPKRILVMDVDWPDREDSALHVLVNPEIVSHEGKVVYDEGCLSFPGLTVPVERHAEVRVRARDPRGRPLELHCTELLAICVQHEMDHLDGLTLVDRAEGARRKQLVAEMRGQPWFRPELLPPDLR